MNRKILIVEDESDILNLYYSILSNKKFIIADVDKASTAEEAVELSKLKEYDLIITDYYLPKMDGIALIKKIKEMYTKTEFIMISGYLTPDIINNAKSTGALYCIQKPSSIQNIIETVKKALSLNDNSENANSDYGKPDTIKNDPASYSGNKDNRNIFVFYIDENDKVTYCDDLFAEKCEASCEEIIGNPVSNYFYSYFFEYLKKTGKSFITFAKENETNKVKIDFLKKKSGERMPLVCEFRNIEKKLMVLCIDEEEKRKLSRLIELEKASSKQLLSGQFDMVITLDDKLQIKTINNICEEKLGISRDDYIGKNISSLIFKKQDDIILNKAVEQVKNLNDVYNLRLDITSNNKNIPALVNIRGVRDDFNNEIGYVLILRDIEKDLRMEDTLSNIERMQALGKLAAGMAHQINNYVSSLLGNTDLLEVELKIDNIDRESILTIINNYINRMRTSISRLSALTKHLTSFARAQQCPVISLGSINRVVNDVLSLTELRIMKKHISFDVLLDDEIPHTYFSPLHLEQAILNILMNAIDAVESKSGIINLKTFKDVNSACISIRDNGPGIPDKIKDKIFEAFVTTKPSGVGTGLGLNVARDIITSLKGDLDVISSQDRGTEMIIKIPIVSTEENI